MQRNPKPKSIVYYVSSGGKIIPLIYLRTTYYGLGPYTKDNETLDRICFNPETGREVTVCIFDIFGSIRSAKTRSLKVINSVLKEAEDEIKSLYKRIEKYKDLIEYTKELRTEQRGMKPYKKKRKRKAKS